MATCTAYYSFIFFRDASIVAVLTVKESARGGPFSPFDFIASTAKIVRVGLDLLLQKESSDQEGLKGC